MNYDKQKRLDQKTIDMYTHKDANYKIGHILTYPHNGVHWEVKWNLPINITYNKDEYWYPRGRPNNEHNIENLWWVAVNQGAEIGFRGCEYITPQGFKNLEDAIKYAIDGYREWLEHRFNDTNKIINNIKFKRSEQYE